MDTTLIPDLNTRVVFNEQLLIEPFPTDGAVVQFLSCVDCHVFCQMDILFETFATN